MDFTKYTFDGTKKFFPEKFDTGDTLGIPSKQEGRRQLAQNIQKLGAWQQKLYAEGKKGLLVILQAMDAAGKDSTVKHVFSGVNPQGVRVESFKSPSGEELAHDYLWRIHNAVPKKGMIGVFNRSHYEDVLVARVMDLPGTARLPKTQRQAFWPARYRQITDFERYLHENDIVVLKFFLHLSKGAQKKRFLARLENPAKNWKFEPGDVAARRHWGAYMEAYKQCVNATATKTAPWYVVPADKKWAARVLVSGVVEQALAQLNPTLPKMDTPHMQMLENCKKALAAEG